MPAQALGCGECKFLVTAAFSVSSQMYNGFTTREKGALFAASGIMLRDVGQEYTRVARRAAERFGQDLRLVAERGAGLGRVVAQYGHPADYTVAYMGQRLRQRPREAVPRLRG